MAEYNVLPDMEAIASIALRNEGIRAYSSIPRNPVWPLVVIHRAGGIPPVRQYLEAARLQLDVWGAAKGDPEGLDKGDIQALAQAARVVLLELEGEVITNQSIVVLVSAVRDSLGIQWLPDPDTGRERYIFGVTLYGRQMTGSSS